MEELNRLFFFCEEYVLVRCALFEDGKVIIFLVVGGDGGASRKHIQTLNRLVAYARLHNFS